MRTIFLLAFCIFCARFVSAQSPLPGTKPLEMQGDIASNLVAGVDRFLLRKLDESVGLRTNFWRRDTSSGEAFARSVETNRASLSAILGLSDPRATNSSPQFLEGIDDPALVAISDSYKVYRIKWPAFGDVHGSGLVAIPQSNAVAHVIAIPHADVTPEQFFGLQEGLAPGLQYARQMAEQGCIVIAPMIIDRTLRKRGNATLSNREFLYRPAFVLGRTLIGYEIQKIRALVDWFENRGDRDLRIGVVGWGEGGLLALYSAAIDTRIDAALVSGYFGNRNELWQEPLDRNLFGLLEVFGDAEIASLILPRALIIDGAKGPELSLPGEGGAPAELRSPNRQEVDAEFARFAALNQGSAFEKAAPKLFQDWSDGAAETFLQSLAPDRVPLTPSRATVVRSLPDSNDRMQQQIHELDRHTQQLLTTSAKRRLEFMNKLNFSSLANFEASTKGYRDYFRNEVIGHFEEEPLPFNARSRRTGQTNNWTSYEVVLDVFPDVIAYGILLLPDNIAPGEKRPVVVCQHGLEGRPQDIIQGDHHAYHDFAAKLAERGFITFSPQNLYLFTDRFRTLQRKANPLKKTLFSIITPQHQQIVSWLQSLPMVDPKRIGFYGLSYGGKTAMRVPALVTDYAFSICSADFNEWVWKNASTQSPYSYVWTGEYEIFEWNLGNTFNYAEMAALIAPRPFMVERGHFDNVAPDETVAHEYAKVRRLYGAHLGIPDRTEIEWFAGPHTINGQRTFDFCHKHLNWPKPKP